MILSLGYIDIEALVDSVHLQREAIAQSGLKSADEKTLNTPLFYHALNQDIKPPLFDG